MASDTRASHAAFESWFDPTWLTMLPEDAFSAGFEAGRAKERARDWRNCEEIDFYVRAAGPNSDGVTWIWLMCSACGNVQATAQGEPSDLGGISVAAQGHLERRHADLLDGDTDGH